jgi:hypothetical protein
MNRAHLPQGIETAVLKTSRRRCCICFGLHGDQSVKRGQIAHLDRNPNNNNVENLAFLCAPCHEEYDSRTSQTKGFTIREVKEYRSELFAYLARLEPPAPSSAAPDPERPRRQIDPEWLVRKLPPSQRSALMHLARCDGGRLAHDDAIERLEQSGLIECVYSPSATEGVFRLTPMAREAACRLWQEEIEHRLGRLRQRIPSHIHSVLNLFGTPEPDVCDCDPEELLPYATYHAIQSLEGAGFLDRTEDPLRPRLEVYRIHDSVVEFVEQHVLRGPLIRRRIFFNLHHIAASRASGGGATGSSGLPNGV